MVVDDDPVIQKLVRLNLEMQGYAVITAGDGLECLAKAGGENPDVVILDVMMPGLSGLEALRALKADPATAAIPVLLLSAKAQPSDLAEGRTAGADDYLAKPFDPEDLVQRVGRLIATC